MLTENIYYFFFWGRGFEKSCSCLVSAGGKCSQQAELSGENINITYKPDGTHVAVGNRVCDTTPFICFKLWRADVVTGYVKIDYILLCLNCSCSRIIGFVVNK